MYYSLGLNVTAAISVKEGSIPNASVLASLPVLQVFDDLYSLQFLVLTDQGFW
jgi:hypothetical protein